MTRAEQLKLIHAAFDALPDLDRGFYNTDKDRLYGLNLTAERAHRRGWGNCGISVPVAARLFTVRFIAEALQQPERYTVADILHIRFECLYAQAIVAKHRVEIEAAWAGAGIAVEQVLELDYPELMI